MQIKSLNEAEWVAVICSAGIKWSEQTDRVLLCNFYGEFGKFWSAGQKWFIMKYKPCEWKVSKTNNPLSLLCVTQIIQKLLISLSNNIFNKFKL